MTKLFELIKKFNVELKEQQKREEITKKRKEEFNRKHKELCEEFMERINGNEDFVEDIEPLGKYLCGFATKKVKCLTNEKIKTLIDEIVSDMFTSAAISYANFILAFFADGVGDGVDKDKAFNHATEDLCEMVEELIKYIQEVEGSFELTDFNSRLMSKIQGINEKKEEQS